jgi:hypothetical protein
MSFHTFGDSHALYPWESISGVVVHHLGAILCHTVGRDGLKVLNISGHVKAGDVACFSFGEIDCRCHVHKHVTAECPFEVVVGNLVRDYAAVIVQNEELAPGVKLAAVGVNPPGRNQGLKHDPNYPFAGSDEDRKKYHRLFNRLLSEACQKAGWLFVDVYDKYAGEDGCLNEAYSDGHVHIVNPVFIKEFLEAHGV